MAGSLAERLTAANLRVIQLLGFLERSVHT
jgi:hypothetical protein